MNADYVCADARSLPFDDGSVDVAFSYSVFQHMDDVNCDKSLREMGRVLKTGGVALVQMANALGIRSFYTLARRTFRHARDFEVRYRTPQTLKRLFEARIGNVTFAPDCYLGLGLQSSDRQLMGPIGALAVSSSDLLKRITRRLPALRHIADSVWVHATKSPA